MTKPKSKVLQYILSFVCILIGAFLLELPHFHNGFPILLGDSQGYILRAINLVESSHQSNTYTYFVHCNIEFLKSIQFAPFIQNLATSGVLYLLIGGLFVNHRNKLFLATILGLVFTTLPWTTNMLMSDIFTPIALLISILIINVKLKWPTFILLCFTYFFAASCHQSNMVILPLFLIAVCIGNFLLIKNKPKTHILALASLLMFLSFFSFMVENNIIQSSTKNEVATATKKNEQVKKKNDATLRLKKKNLKSNKKTKKNKSAKKTKKGKKAKNKKTKKTTMATQNKTGGGDISSGYYFIIVRMWETGQLDKLLASYCPDNANNYLCDPNNPYEIKVHLPDLKDRTETNKDYQKFARDNKSFVLSCLKIPRFYYACVIAAIKRSPTLLKQTLIRNFRPIKNGGIQNGVNVEPIDDRNAYVTSKQFRNKYTRTLVSNYTKVDHFWWRFLLPIVLITYVVFAIRRKSYNLFSKEKWNILLLLCLGHLINTIICGTFSNALNARYSMRTIWLVNLAIILFIFFLKEVIKKKST